MTGDILGILDSLHSDIRLVLLPLAVLGAAASGISMMTSSDAEGRRRSRNALITVVCAAALFEMSPLITRLITSLAERLG